MPRNIISPKLRIVELSRQARRYLLAVILAGLYLFPSQAAQKKELTKYEIVAIATKALTGYGFSLRGAGIIYDENNRLWREKINKMTNLVNSPNFKDFEKEFMKNYQAVLFDFKNPQGELWVFVNKNTGEILEIYRPEFTIGK